MPIGEAMNARAVLFAGLGLLISMGLTSYLIGKDMQNTAAKERGEQTQMQDAGDPGVTNYSQQQQSYGSESSNYSEAGNAPVGAPAY